MQKTKLLLIADRGMPKEKVLEPSVQRLLQPMFELGAELQIVEYEPNMGRDEFSAFAERTEKNGPEWFEPSQEILEAVADAQVVLVHFVCVNRKLLDAAKQLQLVVALRSGVENVNLDAAKARHIPVICAPGRLADPVADLTLCLMLAATRGVVSRELSLHHGAWDPKGQQEVPAHCMRVLTVGLVGFGMIGKKVAERVNSFGSTVLAYDPFASQEQADAYRCKLVTLPKLLAESDLVSVHMRLTGETRHMLGREQFAMMKPSAWLINKARAGILDEDALVQALQQGQIGGAALDVYSKEPLALDHPLLRLHNVILTPHCAGGVEDLPYLSFSAVQENLLAFLQGKPLQRVLNLG